MYPGISSFAFHTNYIFQMIGDYFWFEEWLFFSDEVCKSLYGWLIVKSADIFSFKRNLIFVCFWHAR